VPTLAASLLEGWRLNKSAATRTELHRSSCVGAGAVEFAHDERITAELSKVVLGPYKRLEASKLLLCMTLSPLSIPSTLTFYGFRVAGSRGSLLLS